MIKPLKNPILLSVTELWSVFALGVLMGALTLAVIIWTHQEVPIEDRPQLTAVRTCKLPDANGAMTVYVMESDKIKCWRWK